MSGSYRDLRVWQQGMDFVEAVYVATRRFPESEKYGLTSQLRRASVSVPSNIAEGKGRHTDRDFCSFLFRARGSLLESETQIELSRRLGYIDQEQSARLFKLTAAIGSSLTGLINSLQQQHAAVTSN